LRHCLKTTESGRAVLQLSVDCWISALLCLFQAMNSSLVSNIHLVTIINPQSYIGTRFDFIAVSQGFVLYVPM
jgi:hypothetical protein